MQQIEAVQARIRAAEPLPELLGAGWAAFTLVLDACDGLDERETEPFVAFAFAAAAASRGRLLLASAPSFPVSARSQAGHGAIAKNDLEGVATGLACLAGSLHDRLWQAAAEAPGAGDREACLDAAAYAAQVAGLLSRDG